MSNISDVIQALPDDIKQIHARAEEHAATYGSSTIDPVLYLLAMVELAAGPRTPKFEADGREPASLRDRNGSAVSWLRRIGLTPSRIMLMIDNGDSWWTQFETSTRQANSCMMRELGQRIRPEGLGPTLYRSDLLSAIVLSESVLVMRVFGAVGYPSNRLYAELRLGRPQAADDSLVTGED